MNDELTCSALFDLNETIAGEYLASFRYPWEALGGIHDLILAIGPTLDPEIYEEREEHVWIAKSAKVFPSAYIGAPCIICEDAQVRHCAFIRGDAIVGKGSVVGNSCELKNVILFNKCEVPHFNYVGDSILGFHAHMGAGAITSNIKADRKNIVIRGDERIETGRRKIGAIIGDWAEIGCNAVLNPGTVVGRHAMVYPTTCVRGVLAEDIIMRQDNSILRKHE
ncbi:MAG: UDP-N-acetylglucosamine pyrophosphorylase [Lachnospiraceae bacterium]|nr:UDP-N-acetylglucosamine pyrophosphorylase [Lachnospiraceae bacterium]